MKKPPIVRCCASCKYIFRYLKDDNGEIEIRDCPMCGFGSYGARYVFGDKAYTFEKTQEPFIEDKVFLYRIKLEREIQDLQIKEAVFRL